MELSYHELHDLTARAVDQTPFGPIRRRGMNRYLTDRELVRLIQVRNGQGKPTALLREEYAVRLKQRGAASLLLRCLLALRARLDIYSSPRS